MRARQTGLWHPKNGNEYNQLTEISIDTNKLIRYITETQRYFAEGEEIRANRGGICVTYEDMQDDLRAVTHTVSDFLGVKRYSGALPEFATSSAASTATRIKNVVEVEEALTDVGCAWMLRPYLD